MSRYWCDLSKSGLAPDQDHWSKSLRWTLFIGSKPSFNSFSGYSKQKLGEGEATPFPSTDFGWSPVIEKSANADADDAESSFDRSGGARKKLGFEGLFDQTDPNPENFDDVVGLCSGQFVTQLPLPDDDDGDGVDALAVSQEATPDTIVMTKELTQNATLSVTQDPKDKKASGEEKETQDTVLLSDDEAGAERAPGLFEEYPGFLDSSDSDGEMLFLNIGPEESFSDDLAKLKWHLGQVGPILVS